VIAVTAHREKVDDSGGDLKGDLPMSNSKRSNSNEPFSEWSIPVSLGFSAFVALLFGVGIVKLVEHAVLIAA
jgi:hypothetical protein